MLSDGGSPRRPERSRAGVELAGPIDLLRLTMGAASFGIAAGALFAPGAAGRLAGIGTGAARLLGVRDVVVGVVLLRVGGPVGLVARGSCDVIDAVAMVRRRPAIAAVAAVSAAANLVGAVAAGRSRRPSRSGGVRLGGRAMGAGAYGRDGGGWA